MEGYNYTITAKTVSGINFSLSNYMDLAKCDGVYSLYEIIETAKGDPFKAADMLNANSAFYDKYEPFRVFNGGFILRVTDYNGNKTFMTVKERGSI